MTKYVALLRGINVGGNKKVKMADLKRILEDLGFKNVKTILASGNVVFESELGAKKIKEKIEEALVKELKMSINVIIRSIDQIQQLVNAKPFDGIKITLSMRLYVTFLDEKPKTKLKIPHQVEEGKFRILSIADQDVCSVLEVNEDKRSVDLMKIIEMEFGKNITTRNWNTVLKIASGWL